MHGETMKIEAYSYLEKLRGFPWIIEANSGTGTLQETIDPPPPSFQIRNVKSSG
jgi:hypothetical protein